MSGRRRKKQDQRNEASRPEAEQYLTGEIIEKHLDQDPPSLRRARKNAGATSRAATDADPRITFKPPTWAYWWQRLLSPEIKIQRWAAGTPADACTPRCCFTPRQPCTPLCQTPSEVPCSQSCLALPAAAVNVAISKDCYTDNAAAECTRDCYTQNNAAECTKDCFVANA